MKIEDTKILFIKLFKVYDDKIACQVTVVIKAGKKAAYNHAGKNTLLFGFILKRLYLRTM